ncbi:Hypoxia up-regulated protein 1 [Cyanidiococcus yangmingshanensis]|uniref:Hypoxia up-regulated protein 1 n=1 Tax=Cyanidiococcus yangmingshanensis TaxID=2690220 RepID=A0A7J7IR40_9RHOD|nr:Hypoxia up-regulated protein 1 [Cyanidiococcus yangmingshanensis]
MSPAYGRWPDYAVRGVRTLFEQTNCSGQGALVASSRSQRERLVHRCIVQLGRRQELVFTDIELVGMLLGQVRRRAYAAMRATLSPEEEEQLSSTPNEHLFGSDAVLTVPVWFRQSQRAALVKAARLAGWNVRGLVHTPLAAAIRFALDRAINGTQTVLFVDVGAQGTTTALIRFTTSNKMTKESSTAAGNVPLPVQAIEVLEYAWDDRVGGRAFDHCLSDLVLDRLRERSLLTAAVTGRC